MAVSLFHQGENLNRERIAELAAGERFQTQQATPEPAAEPAASEQAQAQGQQATPETAGPATLKPQTRSNGTQTRSIHDSVVRWIDRDIPPADAMDSLPGVMWHLTDAWRRRDESRRDENGTGTGNILLVHYADLATDLEAEMQHIAAELDIDVPEHRWPTLVEAARFDQMRRNAARLAPDPAGILKDRSAFFRRGNSGAGRELLTDAEFAHYEERVRDMAPADLLEWLNR